MAEPWIRVHANLAGKPVVWRAVKELRVSQHEAIGLLVTFWGAMSQHGNDGLVIALTDEQIEAWGGWRGKRGKFAAFIRQFHTDDDGRVNEWDDYAGKLEDRRQKDRDRKREERDKKRKLRGNSASGHADNPEDGPREVPKDVAADRPQIVRTESLPARAVRNETIRSSSSSSAGAENSIAPRLLTDLDREALQRVLQISPAAETWLAEMGACLDGMPGHHLLTPSQLGEALRDYVGNGGSKTPNLRHFRSYLERAAIKREPRASTNGTPADPTLATLEAMKSEPGWS